MKQLQCGDEGRVPCSGGFKTKPVVLNFEEEINKVAMVSQRRFVGIAIGVALVIGVLVGCGKQPQPTWHPLGPSPLESLSGQAFSGRITSIVMNHSTLFIGAADGGVWSSKSGGKSWNPLTDQQSSLAIGSLAIDPDHRNTIYAGTGELDDSYPDADYGMGILKSSNDGASWSLYGESVFKGQHITKIVIDPRNDNIVYVAANRGIYKSKDAGKHWTRLSTHTSGSPIVTDVELDPTNSNVLYAGIWGYGVLKSTDGGQSWTALNLGINNKTIDTVSLGISANNPNKIYAAIGTEHASHAGLYVSTDGGKIWRFSQTATSYLGDPDNENPTWRNVDVWVDPDNANDVFLGSVNLVESKNGGRTWADLSGGVQHINLHEDVHDVAFGPNDTLYVATDGGIYEKTSDSQWHNLNTNLDITQFYPGLSYGGGVLLGGTQDNGSVSVLLGHGSPAWSQIIPGDGGYTATDPQNPNIQYIAAAFQNRIFRSNSSGSTKNIAPKLANEYTPLPVLRLSLENSTTILLGAGRLYASTDSGISWYALSPAWYVPRATVMKYEAPYPLLSTNQKFHDAISAVAQESGKPNVVIVGTDYGDVYQSNDNGKTWIKSNDASLNLGLSVTSISWTKNGSVYVTFGGGHFNGFHYPTTKQLVLFKRSGSSTWMNVTGNLPRTPVNSSLIYGNEVYVGTGHGVYVASIGKNSWRPYGTGLPNSPITSLITGKQGEIIAGTNGRGVWTIVTKQ